MAFKILWVPNFSDKLTESDRNNFGVIKKFCRMQKLNRII